MALSGLEIYKYLPKTNCRECGFPTCLAFALALAKKSVPLEKCPRLSEEAKQTLESSSLPPIKLVSVGREESLFQAGNETVMFRHEEKFHRPTGVGILLHDSLKPQELDQSLAAIRELRFERVGQLLRVELVAVKSGPDKDRFVEVVKKVVSYPELALVIMADSQAPLEAALEHCAPQKPLVYALTSGNMGWMLPLIKKFSVPAVVKAPSLDELAELTAKLASQGVTDLFLDTGTKPLGQKIWDLTQIRRLALRKGFRQLGYPSFCLLEEPDPHQEIAYAASLVAKYASIVILKVSQPWQVLPVLTLRQNIYTDPQKPLQVEPKIYAVGQADKHAPLLVTTNFSLTYYTVLGEVEASKVPSYLLCVDTEGMSVLTAWAAEKFTADKIAESLEKFAARELVDTTRLIIPGYVAVLSADLEEKSKWQVVVGPREASAIPSFLRNF